MLSLDVSSAFRDRTRYPNPADFAFTLHETHAPAQGLPPLELPTFYQQLYINDGLALNPNAVILEPDAILTALLAGGLVESSPSLSLLECFETMANTDGYFFNYRVITSGKLYAFAKAVAHDRRLGYIALLMPNAPVPSTSSHLGAYIASYDQPNVYEDAANTVIKGVVVPGLKQLVNDGTVGGSVLERHSLTRRDVASMDLKRNTLYVSEGIPDFPLDAPPSSYILSRTLQPQPRGTFTLAGWSATNDTQVSYASMAMPVDASPVFAPGASVRVSLRAGSQVFAMPTPRVITAVNSDRSRLEFAPPMYVPFGFPEGTHDTDTEALLQTLDPYETFVFLKIQEHLEGGLPIDVLVEATSPAPSWQSVPRGVPRLPGTCPGARGLCEVELDFLTIPNTLVSSRQGGYPINYPHFYLEFGNAIAPCTRLLSNNPFVASAASGRAIFKVTLVDIKEHDTAGFLKATSACKHVMPLSLDEELVFRLYLPSGELFTPVLVSSFPAYTVSDAYPTAVVVPKPYEQLGGDSGPDDPPDPTLQISATFKLRPVVGGGGAQVQV